jgi:hypothetical protein
MLIQAIRRFNLLDKKHATANICINFANGIYYIYVSEIFYSADLYECNANINIIMETKRERNMNLDVHFHCKAYYESMNILQYSRYVHSPILLQSRSAKYYSSLEGKNS